MNFTKEEELKIVQMYNDEKLSTVKIGKCFNCGNKVIAKVLDKYDIPRIGNGRRKFFFDENYFDVINTQNKAYILGFLFADGNNTLSKCTIRISLKEEDKDILERMRLETKFTKPLKYKDNSLDDHNGYISKNAYVLEWYSKHLCETLNNIGMIPNKSLSVEFPTIPNELFSHFIRGYYDGNGSIHRSIKNENNHAITVTITSTDKFCNALSEICMNELNLKSGIYDASNHNGITKVFTLSGRNKAKIFLDWIYKDADMFLKRKHDRYIEYYDL